MSMKKIIITLSIVLFALNIYAQQTWQRVEISNSEIRKITSVNVAGQEYQLQVSLPAHYANSNKKYPVLYLMDAQWDLPLLECLYGQQYFDGFIPEMIIVGITWGGVNPNPDSLRARDYTPTNEKRLPQSGGADKFIAFIQNEVFPFIESNYKADQNDRILMGCSLGGLFTMYTLFTHPNMFNRYVAASPAFMWDNEVLYQYEKKYFENKNNPPAKLFMCIGGVERSVPGYERLTKFLTERKYTNLQIESRILENTGHSGTKGEGYARGLQFIFKRPSLQLDEKTLNKYAGNYVMNNTSITMKIENNHLAVYFSPTNKFTLNAAGDGEFYATSQFLNIYFTKNNSGNVDGCKINFYEQNQTAHKIN